MTVKIDDYSYKKEAAKETALWNKTANDELKSHPPDYSFYKQTLPYQIYRHPYVVKMLSQINPGDRVLELGCYNGWFSLEMARKGAIVDAHDIAPQAISIAKKYYLQQKRIEKFTGKINYYVTDLNDPKFPKNKYDKVVIRNVLHHLINLKGIYKKLNQSLKPNALILIDDALPCGKKEALFTGILLTLLPSDIPYRQKLRRIFGKGQILKRTQDMVDAKGASPFESVSGEKHSFYLKKMSKFIYHVSFSAFVGTITGHLNLPFHFKKILLIIINILDKFLIKIGLFKGTSYYLVAKKIE